jgi:hypothetical protein
MRATFYTHPISFGLIIQLNVNYVIRVWDMFSCTEVKAGLWLIVMKSN